MSRRTCRVSHDEVRRMVKAVQACGLAVGKVIFDGSTVSVVISGDIGQRRAAGIDDELNPETVQSLDEYKLWRDRERARGA